MLRHPSTPGPKLHLAILTMSALLAGCSAGPPETPLFAGIPERSSHDERRALLTERMGRKFPVGGPEAGLEEYLTTQGFETKRMTNTLAPGRPICGQAQVRYGPGLCQMIVNVHWRGDPHGMLTELHVEHSADLCIG